MSRFRPNIVLRGGNSLPPFAEDYMRVIQIMEKNDPTKRKGIFHVVSSCARCKQSCTDQKTGRVTEEPVATMRDFRRLNPKEPEAVYFAVNAIPAPGSEGCPIDVGDIIQVLQWGNPTWGDP